jgi:uncharacterized caspase-like protein
LRPDDFAIVVGIEDYQALPVSSFGLNDAASISRAFIEIGVPEQNIVVLSDSRASLSAILKYVEGWLPKRVKPASRVYFYFSGHGSPDSGSGSPYLMPWDADSAFVTSTGYSLSRLYESLADLPSRESLVILDSCFSGAGGRSVIASGMRPLINVSQVNPPARVSVFAASERNEIASSQDESRHGLFTHYLLQGLSGDADANKDGHVTLQELYRYVQAHVIIDARRSHHEQTPTLSSDEPGMRLY